MPAGDPVRVFLCDDVPELRTLVRYGLEEYDRLEVVGEADEPVTGIPMIRESRPDAVVLDLSMPQMDGLEAISEIRRADPGVAIVVYSGFLEGTVGEDAVDLGADAYLSKSEPMERLGEALLGAVESRRLRGGPDAERG